MDTFLNIAGLVFMVTGIVTWVVVLFLMWFYWLCMPKEGE